MTGTIHARPHAGVRILHEVPVDAGFPLWRLDEWDAAMPWLVHGITGRDRDAAFDMSLFGELPTQLAQARWEDVRGHTCLPFAVHARQVHGGTVLRHDAGGHGLLLAPAGDGHVTRLPGVLLTVTVADCVPISIVDPVRRAIALLHAGWRGIAAEILAHGLDALRELASSDPADLRVHLGPAICGSCYEVGPDVHAALGNGRVLASAPIDLRALLADQAAARGVQPQHLSVSGHCTRCGTGFHSHRAGASERQIAMLGIRDPGAA